MLDEEEEVDLNDVNKGGKVDPANTTPSIFGLAPQIIGAWASLGHCDMGKISLEGVGLVGVPK